MSRRRGREPRSFRIASTGFSRDVNRTAILRLVASAGPIARKGIAARLGLSSATVTGITKELIDQGLIREADTAPSSGGRPAVLLELVVEAATVFGAKVAPDHVVGVRTDLAAKVLERFEAPFDTTAPGAVAHLAALLDGWLDRTPDAPPLLGVGIGVAGVFDAASGQLDSPLLGWRDVPLAQVLGERLDAPVFVDNDVNTLAVWERLYGRGERFEHFLTVTIGRGVGLGIVAGGDIYRGFRGGAGEFGHVNVVEDGPLCTCGKRGCLEAVAADPALLAQAREAGLLHDGEGIERLLALAEAGEPRAVAIYDRAGAVLGRAVSGLVNVLAPERVLLSGEGTRAWTWLEPGFERGLRDHLFPAVSDVRVEVDPWDDAKWAVGAASLVLRATFNGPLDGEHNDLARARIGASDPAEVID